MEKRRKISIRMLITGAAGLMLFAPFFAMAATTIGTNITTGGNLTVNGSLLFTNGATDGYVMQTDAIGNATWVSVSSTLSEASTDDLGEGVANLYYDDALVDAYIDTLLGAPDGIAPLDGTGLVPMANLPAGVSNGLATLDAGGMLAPGQIPDLAINNTYVVADIAARDALTVETGDVAIVIDAGLGDSRSYIWDGAAWIELLTPLSLYLSKANNLSDLANAATARSNLVLGTADSPEFTGLTLSGLTDGSVLYTDGGGIISEDNANFYWDSGNQRLGIGTNLPDYALDVAGDIKTGDGSLMIFGSKADPDPAGVNGAMYYNATSNVFRCYENGAWTDCIAPGGGGGESLQDTYDIGATITTALATPIAFTLTSGDFNVSGAGAVNLTPTGVLTLDSSGAVNLGTTNATSVNIGKAAANSNINVGIGTGIDTINIGTGGTANDTINIGTNTGTASTVNIGSSSAGAITINSNSLIDIGKSGKTTTNKGILAVDELLNAKGSVDLGDATADTITFSGLVDSDIVPSADNSYDLGSGPNRWKKLYVKGGSIDIGNDGNSALFGYDTVNNRLTFDPDGNGTADLFMYDSGSFRVANLGADPGTANNGDTYYNTISNKFRCYENGAWTDCVGAGGGGGTLQDAYDLGATITTAGATDIDFTLTSGDFNVSGAGAVNLTPTGTLTLDSSAAVNLGTTNATGVSIGKAATTTAVNGVLAIPGYIDFDPIVEPALTEGVLYYDDDEKALTYYNDIGEVHLGQHNITRVYNQTGSQIDKGSVVYVNGVFGDVSTVALARADSENTIQVIGIANQDIANNDYGYVVSFGIIHDIDTAAYSVGDSIYLSETTAGAFTTAMPVKPNYIMFLGYITKSDPVDGMILAEVPPCPMEGGYTVGGVAFGTTSGVLNADSANLYWDDTNNRLGILDNTPTAAFVVGSGDLFQVMGATGNVTTQGDITLSTGGGTIISTGGGLGLTGGGASTYSTTTGNITLQPAGSGTTGTVQIGVDGVGSATPDLLGLDVKSDAGDPAGFNGAMYYNANGNRFRCYENSAWKDCDAGVVASLQTAYYNGGFIVTNGNPIAFTLTSGDFTASGAGSVNLTPTGASSFTSGAGLTLTGGTASTWSTLAGNLTLQAGSGTISLGSTANLIMDAGLTITGGSGDIKLQPAGSATTARVFIGDDGAGSATPDVLVLDVKSTAGDPATTDDGGMYYNEFTNKFRCHINGSWNDCDTTGGTVNLQAAYNNGATITTSAATDIALTLTSGNFTASGAGSVNLTPTGASSFTSGAALTLTGGAASTWGTSSGDLTLQVAGAGTTANVKIGAGGAGSATPDLFALDVKSSAGDPAGYNGAMYYNEFSDVFRCYENSGWKDCGLAGAGASTLQQVYTAGATITTSGAVDIALTLTSGNFTATGAGSVNLTPTGASSFTSGDALTIQGGATSTWGTSAGDLKLQVAGAGTVANVQIGAGGAGSGTPDLLVLDVKSTALDPAGTNGAMYYNSNTNKIRVYENGAWKNQDSCDGGCSLQSSYDNGATITTAGAVDIALTLTSGNLTASGAGSVNLTPTGASSFTSGAALTLTGGAPSTWSTSAGALTVDSAAALNLGTTNATSVSIGKTATTTTVNGALVIPKYADFTSTSDPAYAEGRAYYDAGENTLAVYTDMSVPFHIGRASWVRVYNQTGSQIDKGRAVYINGVFSGMPSVALAKADNKDTSEVLGLILEDIPNNDSGYVVSFGHLHDVDTSAYSAGDLLYLSATSAGDWTATLPVQPYFSIPLGHVVTSDATTGFAIVQLVYRVLPGAYTAGAVSFGGADGLLKEDSSNLFWDDTNNRLGIGDNTPTASLVVGSGDLFQVMGASGNVTTQGDLTLTTGGGTITSTGGGLNLTSGSDGVNFQASGTGTTANIQVGAGGAGSATPDYLALDVKSTTGDPAGGTEGYMYYNTFDNKFRCYEGAAWKDCDVGGTPTLQQVYNAGATITTAGAVDLALTLTSGNFTASGAGSVNLTPTGASSFTSAGALTLTGGAASTWSTSAGALTITSAAAATWGTAAGSLALQAAGTGTTANVQIGAGGAGSATPDYFALDVKSTTGDPAGGAEGYMYYNTFDNKFRCYEGAAWKDCDTGVVLSTVTAAQAGNTIASGDNAQVWNWSLTTADKAAFTFGESSASTALGAPAILKASTLASSTAMPLYVKNIGAANSLQVDDENGDTTPFVIDEDGNVAIGNTSFDPTNPEKLLIDAGATSSINVIAARGSIDNYLQLSVQNMSSGNSASADLVASADNGDESNYYVDVGINSSTYSDPAYSIGGPNDSYLYNNGGELSVGTQSPGTIVKFHTGGTTSGEWRMSLEDTGLVLLAQNDVRFADADSSNWAAFQSPAAIGTNYTLTLPADDGASGEFLATDGSGVLSWTTANPFGASIDSSEITDDTITAADLSAALTFADADILNLSGINMSSTTEGLILGQNTSCAAATAEGQVCWDTDNNILYIGDGAAAAVVSNPFGVSIDSAEITDATITGDDIAASLAGAGLTLTGGAPDTLDVGAGNGIAVAADSVAVQLLDAIDSVGSISAYSGLEFGDTGGNELTLLQGCADGEVLKWEEDTDTWDCAADNAGGAGADTLDFTEFQDALDVDAATTIALAANSLTFNVDGAANLVMNASSTGDIFLQDGGTNRIQVLDDGTLTLTAGAVSTWSTSAGALTVDSAAALNLGSVNATSVLIGKSGITTTSVGTFQVGQNGTDGQLRIYSEQGGTDYEVIFNPNAAMTASTTYTLPPDDGASGQLLATDGSGALSWTTVVPSTSFMAMKYKSADEDVVSSAVLQNDDNLSFPIAAGETWIVMISLLTLTQSNTPDLQMAIAAPAGATCNFSYSMLNSPSSGAETNLACGVTSSRIQLTAGSNENVFAQVRVTNGGTPGTVQLQWSQATSNANYVRIQAGSFLEAMKAN